MPKGIPPTRRERPTSRAEVPSEVLLDHIGGLVSFVNSGPEQLFLNKTDVTSSDESTSDSELIRKRKVPWLSKIITPL